MTLPRFLNIHEISQCVVRPTESFDSILRILSDSGFTLCVVCDHHGNLLGIVTDSDIRKSLLNNSDLSSPVSNIMNASPYSIGASASAIQAQSIMVCNHFFHLPVVSSENKLLGVFLAPQICTPSIHPEHLVIMAGGRGRRLMPLTNSCPKPMLPINGKPILQHLIESAKSDGFTNIFISVNYLAHQIIDYFGDGSQFGVSIGYLQESEPLGTAGCLSLLPSQVLQQPVLVMNGDVISSVSLSDIMNHCYIHDSKGVMAVRAHEWQNPYGVVHTNGLQYIGLDEKPTSRYLVNAGIYVVSSDLLNLLDHNEYMDMPSLFDRGKNDGLRLITFPIHESWIDIGRPDEYSLASSFLLS